MNCQSDRLGSGPDLIPVFLVWALPWFHSEPQQSTRGWPDRQPVTSGIKLVQLVIHQQRSNRLLNRDPRLVSGGSVWPKVKPQSGRLPISYSQLDGPTGLRLVVIKDERWPIPVQATACHRIRTKETPVKCVRSSHTVSTVPGRCGRMNQLDPALPSPLVTAAPLHAKANGRRLGCRLAVRCWSQPDNSRQHAKSPPAEMNRKNSVHWENKWKRGPVGGGMVSAQPQWSKTRSATCRSVIRIGRWCHRATAT
jgi:hypothetical protein